MALPSEPAPDFPLVAQAPSSFSLPQTDSFSSTPHSRGQSDSGELSLPTNQDFTSPIDRNIASEGSAGVGLRPSVMSQASALPTHLSSSISLSATRNLATTLGNVPPLGGSGLPIVSSHTVAASNPLSLSNPLPSFLQNPTSLSSLASIGGGVTNLHQSGLRLQEGAGSLSQHPNPPQLPPLPPHLSSFPFPFAAVSSHLQSSSSSLGMSGPQPQQQQHSRGQTMSQNLVATVASTRTPPSTQHIQQHNIQQPNMAPTQGLQQPQPTLSTSSNLSVGGMPMPLSHNIAGGGGLSGNLSNPPALPLLPTMHNMYPYPYTGALPSATAVPSVPNQPITSAVVRMNTPGFPGYPSYIAPSLYGNAQPPVTNTSFTR